MAEVERVDVVDGQVPLPGMPEPARVCTCGPGAWGTCDQCGTEAWIKHHCPFPCDDVTCEDGSLCIGCLIGRPCPMHNDYGYGEGWDDEVPA